MMPWEHVFVGYICYSVFVHAVFTGPPTGSETLTVVLASLLPDLVDKPLAWEFGVFASGNGIAHSIFFALPVSIVVGWFVASRGRARLGWAFAVGYLLHPPGDVVSTLLREGEFQPEKLLWPVRSSGDGYENGFVGELSVNLVEYVVWVSRQLESGDLDPYLFVVLGIGVVGISLWVYDGMPAGREATHAVRRTARTLARSIGR